MPILGGRAVNRRVREHGHGGWLRSQITVGNMINLGAIAFAFAGFYFTTNHSLDAHSKSIAHIERQLAEGAKKDEKREKQVSDDREKTRSEINMRAEKTADGIAELNKQTAVLSTKLVGIREELVKLGQQLAAKK
jgi:septal ring factor EnvC (AmiA/AmiB activator)